MIDGKTIAAGVMGAPVCHSLSPLIHNYWLSYYEINGVYLPLPIQEGQFETAVRGLMAAGFKGVNVTIPFKEAAFRLADECDALTELMGSVNTLIFDHEQGKIKGTSTDGRGFWSNLEESGYLSQQQGKQVLVLGAGGAGRAIAGILAQKGMGVTLANRSAGRAETLAGQLSSLGHFDVMGWDRWEEVLGRFDLLVNTTSLGMGAYKSDPNMTFAPDLSKAAPHLVVADIVYTPLVTPFLKAAADHNLRSVGGLGMLIHQARSGFYAWFGTMPVVNKTLIDLLTQALTSR